MDDQISNVKSGFNSFKRCCYFIFFLEVLLAIAHLFLDDISWGQGDRTFFNLSTKLSFGYWLISIQFIGIAILSFISFHKKREDCINRKNRFIWILIGLVSLMLSFSTITRFLENFLFISYKDFNVYTGMITFSVELFFLGLLAWFLYNKLRKDTRYIYLIIIWIGLWSLYSFACGFREIIPQGWKIWYSLMVGLSGLSGATLLLIILGRYVFYFSSKDNVAVSSQKIVSEPFTKSSNRFWILLGVSVASFILISLEIILFQFLTIFSDYLTSNSIISIALMGGAIGGLIGFFYAHKKPIQIMIASAFTLPLAILLIFGTSVMLMEWSLIASLLLMAPFICTGLIISIALTRMKSHKAYFVILLGAGLAALLINLILKFFKEENSLIFLATLAPLMSLCFVTSLNNSRFKKSIILLSIIGVVLLAGLGVLNLKNDWLNITRTKLRTKYPKVEILFSSSSYISRYDIIRRNPSSSVLKATENGRVIDTIRPYKTKYHQIDPRIPNNWMENPRILIIGLSGDGISKSAKFLSNDVYGIEINPEIVDLQSTQLREFNAHSYEDINVEVIDGRSYVEQIDITFDIITLLNTHFARGSIKGREPYPEYLYTSEVINHYMDNLSENGILVLEELFNNPVYEVPSWKLLFTMRQVLLERGYAQPEKHFLVFQWKTSKNNYLQILMKKTPIAEQEIFRLQQWLHEVDNIREIEKTKGHRMGQITAKTTLLHHPFTQLPSNISRIVRGKIGKDFLHAHNIQTISDDRPFMFDVDPDHPMVKRAYLIILILVLLLVPFSIYFLGKRRLKLSTSHLLTVALTGLGYMLIEIILIQRLEIFLGSPVATFSSVVGTLLIFSGLGSLWSGRIGKKGVYFSLGVILIMLVFHQFVVPLFLPFIALLALHYKILLVVCLIAPLGFFLGVPFPFVLRIGKKKITESLSTILYASNAATSALAVPLAFNISTVWGLKVTFLIGLFIYVIVWILLIGLYNYRFKKVADLSAIIVICLLFTSPWLSGKPRISSSDNSSYYKVYAVSCGSSTLQEKTIFLGGSRKERKFIEWMFWIVKSNDRIILIDTCFEDPALIRKWKTKNYVHPAERLTQMGISPADVDDIILTHAHWDHIGTLRTFKNARIWIQQEEFDHAKSVLNSTQTKKFGMRIHDLHALIAAEKFGRVHLINGEKMLIPGVSMVWAGGHTSGSQFVVVNTLDGPVVIAGDNTYLYKNNQLHAPIGDAHDHDENLAAIKKMHSIAASPFLIIPGHDPLVMHYFPEVSDGIVKIQFE